MYNSEGFDRGFVSAVEKAINGAADGWDYLDIPDYDVVNGTESEYLRGQLELLANGFAYSVCTDEEIQHDCDVEFTEVMNRFYLLIRKYVFERDGEIDPKIKPEFDASKVSTDFVEALFTALAEGRNDDALVYARTMVGL